MQSRLNPKKIERNVDFPKGNCQALADWRAAAPGLGGLVRAGYGLAARPTTNEQGSHNLYKGSDSPITRVSQ